MSTPTAYAPLRTVRRGAYGLRAAELNGHLMTCLQGCSIHAIACPEGERLAERVAQAGTMVHDAGKGWV